MNNPTCTVDGCTDKAKSRQLCNKHYTRWYRTGTTASKMDLSPAERFAQHVRRSDTCWEWAGTLHSKGYGIFSTDGGQVYAHRYSYEMAHGPIPNGVLIDHICHNHACVRPGHLRPASNAENVQYRSGPQVNNTSGHRGVYFHKASQSWHAVVKLNGRKVSCGYFTTADEAGAAARDLREKLFAFPEFDGAKR